MGTFIDIIFIIVIIIIIIMNLGLAYISNGLTLEKNETELSGFEIAKKISKKLAKEEPHIIKKQGRFLDFYDANRNVIKLAPEVFDGTDIYSSIIAITIALETDKTKPNIARNHYLSNFLVVASYLLIIMGALLNNSIPIRTGFILFIIAFLIELFTLNIYGKTREEMNKLYEFVKKANVLKPFEEYKQYIAVLLLLPVARLPYRFISLFK